MSTISNPDPTIGKIPPASSVAQASAKTDSSMWRDYPLRRTIAGALGALALMVGIPAVVTSVAAPTASAMRAECENHLRAAGWAYDHGMDDVGDIEYYAWVDCMRAG